MRGKTLTDCGGADLGESWGSVLQGEYIDWGQGGNNFLALVYTGVCGT